MLIPGFGWYLRQRTGDDAYIFKMVVAWVLDKHAGHNSISPITSELPSRDGTLISTVSEVDGYVYLPICHETSFKSSEENGPEKYRTPVDLKEFQKEIHREIREETKAEAVMDTMKDDEEVQ